MAADKTILELFQPLAQRLAIIEGQRADVSQDHLSLLNPLAERLMTLPEQEIISEIDRYLKWITDIVKINNYNAKLSNELPWAENIDNSIISELKNYVSTLESFIDKVKAYRHSPIPVTNNQLMTIELNGALKVADFKGVFESKLTTQEIALLLYFLQTLGHIPPYTANSLGVIALPLFVKSQQTVKTAIGDIQERNIIRAEDLRSLKKHLEELVSTIDANIERLKKQEVVKKV